MLEKINANNYYASKDIYVPVSIQEELRWADMKREIACTILTLRKMDAETNVTNAKKNFLIRFFTPRSSLLVALEKFMLSTYFSNDKNKEYCLNDYLNTIEEVNDNIQNAIEYQSKLEEAKNKRDELHTLEKELQDALRKKSRVETLINRFKKENDSTRLLAVQKAELQINIQIKQLKVEIEKKTSEIRAQGISTFKIHTLSKDRMFAPPSLPDFDHDEMKRKADQYKERRISMAARLE